jgi:hypothetical protein
MIGGPNDVLVESQINRAVVPARESNLASPLLVPSAPVRRTEAAALPASPAVPEPPPKVAAKVPASPLAPPPAAPAPAAPVPKAPAPAQPTASVSDQAAVPAQAVVPAQLPAAELARPAPVPPAATQVPEPARPAPANSPPPRQADPRPAQVRATMPPPIIPANASPNRGAPVRATETAQARGPGNPPGLSPVAPAPPRRPEKAEPAVAGSKAESIAPMAKTEAPAAPTVTTVPPANAGLAQARPAPKTVSLTPASDWARKSADASPPGDKTNAAPSGKPSPKVDDPFADLDSLESEMARLLGREKSD